MRMRDRYDWFPLLLMLPALVLLGVILLYPIVRGLWMSFYEVSFVSVSRQETFVGLDNYRAMLANPYFWNSVRVTVIYTVLTVGLSFAIGLGTALLLNTRFPGRAAARLVMIIPWAVPAVVAVLIWTWMLDANFGVANYLLVSLHIVNQKLAWLPQPELALAAVTMVTVWQFFPIATVMILGGLQTIPEELYEAASIDGSGALGRFRWVTWPGLAPVTVVLVLLLTLNAFRTVTIVYIMTGGGPARATETLSVATYLEAFKFFRGGDAAAIGVVMLLVSLIFTVIYLLALGRREGGE